LCLDAASGKEVWQNKYPATAVGGAARQHPGPRSTPAVAEGKVCTLGVGGVLSCLDAATGKVIWQKKTGLYPQFYTASSPLIVDGKCIAFIGKSGMGDLGAFDLATGEPGWQWTEQGPAYGSPVLLTVDGMKQLATLTDKELVGISL